MGHTNKVIQSVNLAGDTICVDIFIRPDGSFGFDEFRRDIEDGRGWFSIGHHGQARFDSLASAQDAARNTVPWFGEQFSLKP